MDAPKSCCPNGSWPALQANYQGQGTKFNLADTTVYHVGNAGGKTLIIISDIFGATSARHQSVADTYAKLGYDVYLPEILVTPYSPDMSIGIMDCIAQQNWEIMESRFKALHEYLNQKGVKEFFAIAFCWGVWACFKFAAKFDGFKGIAGFHPSFGVAGLFKEDEADIVGSVKCPAFLYPAQNDPANIKQGGSHVDILAKKFGADKVGSLTFTEQVHGWVVRGDVNIPAVHRDVELALKSSHEYFSKL